MGDTRRLAAIMFTDMVGYSTSAHLDEAATLQRLHEEEELVRPIISEHHGREVKSTGDGFLLEFESALEATQCAVEVQRRLHERNTRPDAVPILLRIGIHLGDVEQHRGDIFGDAVNIASRIEPLAEEGGICVSQQVFDQVQRRLPHSIERLGVRSLKGASVPVPVYRILLPWNANLSARSPGARPRVAVLPLANISPDPKDEYFADGLTEELISVLSGLNQIRVIARTSVAQYKSTTKSIGQIANELEVDWVLEGSVRKAGEQLRITVQLIEASSQEHSWANSYDRELRNVFAVQAEIAKEIADRLKIKIAGSEDARLAHPPKIVTDSYLAYLQGRNSLLHRDLPSLRKAHEEFERAISLDPMNARAYCGIAETLVHLHNYHHEGPHDWRALGQSYLSRALAIDPTIAELHAVRGLFLKEDYQHVEAEREFSAAISINPSYANAHHWYALTLLDMGQSERALQELTMAEEADPLSVAVLYATTRVLVWLERYPEAAGKLERLSFVEGEGAFTHQARFSIASQRKDLARARAELEFLRQGDPSPESQLGYLAYKALFEGDRAKCTEILEEMKRTLSPEVLPVNLAYLYAELGDIDHCFEWLEKSLRARSMPLHSWKLNPLFAKVRADPRFDALLRTQGLA